ncbi:class I SAM-dependent methyltransferase [Chloroflexi bacterium TSY]|nr:class I SAM-dependent methyltransferase [Chloroflexi bacterium TSY]
MTKYERAHDMDSWLRDPRIAERGFAHRWQSSVAAGNGEDAFIELVDQHLRPEYDVLDLGCGHGELTLSLAARCRTVVGIERESGYLELAKELAAEQNVTNAQFYEVNLAGIEDEDRIFAGIPLGDDSIDLFVNRRGPLLKRYLDEALRVARGGAVIVGLHPAGNAPAPTWHDQLPEPYRNAFTVWSCDEVMGWVIDPLQTAGISDYSLWWIDVPEFLRTPDELYVRLGGSQTSDALEYQNIKPQLTKIFNQYSTSQGIVLRHQRLLWRAFLPQ